VRGGRDDLFAEIADGFGLTAVAATTFQNTFQELEHEGIDTDAFTHEMLYGVFRALKEGKFAKEAVPALLREMAAGTPLDAAVSKLGLSAVDEGEAQAIIAKIVDERADYVKANGEEGRRRADGPRHGGPPWEDRREEGQCPPFRRDRPGAGSVKAGLRPACAPGGPRAPGKGPGRTGNDIAL
jgi:hypothetical protein